MSLAARMWQWVSGMANPETVVNANFKATQFMAVYAPNAQTTELLTWGYIGGRWGGHEVTDGTLTLAASQTNCLVVNRSDGVISTSTSDTNWNDTENYARVFKLTTGPTTVTGGEDHRAGEHGIFAAAALPPGSGPRNAVTAVTSSSGTLTLDYESGDYFTVTLSENVTTLTLSNLPGSGKGATLALRITQDSTAHTFAWPASFKWSGAAPAVSTGSGAVDLLIITSFNSGTSWQANLAKGYA